MSSKHFKRIMLTAVVYATALASFTLNEHFISHAKAQSNDWVISEFHSDIKINQDSSIEITEKIVADFTKVTTSKHGIIRNIPTKYKDRNMQNLNLQFDLINVKNENGNNYQTTTYWENNDVNIRIGSPDIDVSGTIKTYFIKYKLKRGINQFPEHDELYWNVTGNGWDTKILKASAIVHIPETKNREEMKAICYTGKGYSTEQNCSATIKDNSTYEFISNTELQTSEGLTIAAAFPKNLINFPNYITYITWFILDNWGYLIPIITFLICLFIWKINGQDPKAIHSTIVPTYEPPNNLRPAEVGTLIDDKADIKEITGTIIDLATRGYLKIIEEKKDKKLFSNKTSYTLEKTTPPTQSQNTLKEEEYLLDFEEKIYNKVFGKNTTIKLSSLKNKFYKYIPEIKEKIYESLVEKKYYDKNPDKVRNKYIGIGVTMLVGPLFLAQVFLENVSFFIGTLIAGIVVLYFSTIMPKKTQLGSETKIKVLGLEEFLKTAEKDRMKFYEDQNIFEKMLPYAITLGLADKWAKACKELEQQPPSWYESNDNSINAFNSIYFLRSLDNFNRTMSSNMTSTPPPESSAARGTSGFGGGGGYSGGGFGGGGGRSW